MPLMSIFLLIYIKKITFERYYTNFHISKQTLFLDCNGVLFCPISFVLNTTITAAHTDRIISMCFSSSEETTMLVTTAEDAQFKAWCQGADADTQRESNPSDTCLLGC